MSHPTIARAVRFACGDGAWWRIPLSVVPLTAVMYAAGWGAPLAVLHLGLVTAYVSACGSRAWKPVAAAAVAAIGAGQALIAGGVLDSRLDAPQSHVLAALVAAVVVAGAWTLGRFAEDRERAEASARRGEERLRALVRDGSEVITLCDASGDVTWVSPAARPVLGYKPEELRGQVLRGLFHPEDEAASVELFARLLTSDSTVEHSAELRVRHANGSWYWHEIVARNMLAHPSVQAIVTHQRDITDRRAAQDRIAYAASHDALTGLANGATLERDLARALAQGTRYQHPVAMLLCDLDGFRAINETYGHDVGDRLLQTVSGVLKRTTRETDTAGRRGGDEFGVLLTHVRGADEAMTVARRIIEGVSASAAVAGLRLEVGCTVGVALAYPGGTDAKTLIRHADRAMHRGKDTGRDTAVLYVEDEISAPWA
ncbi:diguanylate cyclase domain-containing protein [Nucisporomicrobium flavum]|uniref:sensor domain-containing diguanylate cyclase n=1 Tax=Nucisporomicrobium flavum TaxID=2785915 RepID=UPI0018F55798|nr:sensor domain-containing diguanylate cyclase [Nucisporomicrobium flavum]